MGNSEFQIQKLGQMVGNGENRSLKDKNGQFYSIKWLKYGFSQKGSDRIK